MVFAFGFGSPGDIAIIAGVVILLFGGAKLPGFMKSLGEGMKEFKKATQEMTGGSDAPDQKPVAEAPASTAAQAADRPAVTTDPSTK
jgi:sec-independent protein translocase protein TatA